MKFLSVKIDDHFGITMAQSSDLSNNLTTGFVTRTDLKYLVTNIFSGNIVPELDLVGNQTHPSGKTNLDFHHSQTLSQVTKVSTSTYDKMDYIISRISLSRYNRINIDVHIQKSKDKIHFYIVGPDLVNYFIYLPKIAQYPRTGTANSKWYGIECKDHLVSVAVKLKLLEHLLFGIRISESYATGVTGILGVEVPFEIPSKYTEYEFISSESQIMDQKNPTKISGGIFLFGKNGVKPTCTEELLGELRTRFSHIEMHVYPSVIREYDLADFVGSPYKFAICAWNKHARILVKSCRGVDILIIDPWMNGLPRAISTILIPTNPAIKIGFFSRTIKDQKTEGSCVFCAFARLVSLVDSFCLNDSDKAFISSALKPIDDFYAYLIKTIYLQ